MNKRICLTRLLSIAGILESLAAIGLIIDPSGVASILLQSRLDAPGAVTAASPVEVFLPSVSPVGVHATRRPYRQALALHGLSSRTTSSPALAGVGQRVYG